jgi:hypothetical protein
MALERGGITPTPPIGAGRAGTRPAPPTTVPTPTPTAPPVPAPAAPPVPAPAAPRVPAPAAPRETGRRGGAATTQRSEEPLIVDAATVETTTVEGARPGASDWWGRPPEAATAAPPDAFHTRNGLRKRCPQGREARPVPAVSKSPVTEDRAEWRRSPAVDRSPTELQSRLTSLRAGVHRGETTQVTGQVKRDPTGQATQRPANTTGSTPANEEGVGREYR